MADVGREPAVPVDAVLQVRGHVVERRDEAAQVRVVHLTQAGVEAAAGDGLGGHADVGERPQRPPATPTSRGRRRPGW